MMLPKKLDPDSIGYVNCRHCDELLTGEKTAKHVWALTDEWPGDMAKPVFVRVNGVPLCERCGKSYSYGKWDKKRPEA